MGPTSPPEKLRRYDFVCGSLSPGRSRRSRHFKRNAQSVESDCHVFHYVQQGIWFHYALLFIFIVSAKAGGATMRSATRSARRPMFSRLCLKYFKVLAVALV
jgi:hypothetical protein